MLSNELKELVVLPARNMILIWCAMMAASLIYLVVAWILLADGPGEADGAFDPKLLMAVFGFAGLGSALASVILERVLLSEKTIMQKLGRAPDVATALGNQSLTGRPTDKEKTAIFGNLSGTEQRLACLLAHYQTAMIVTWAMREAIAILGLVLVILLGEFMMVVPFVVVALALIAIKPAKPLSFLEANRNRAQNFG